MKYKVEIRKMEDILFRPKSGEYGISRVSDEIIKYIEENDQ